MKTPSLIRKEDITCENCGTQTSENNLFRHKKRSLVGTPYCAEFPNFSTRWQVDLNFHVAKKHSLSQPKNVYKAQFCHQVFDGFQSLRLHRQTCAQRRKCIGDRNLYVTQLMGGVDDESLKEELKTCKQFLLDSEIENGRQKVFNFAIEILDAHASSRKLDTLIKSFKIATKLKVSFGFVLKKMKIGLVGNFVRTNITVWWNNQNLWLPNKF